MSTPRFTPWARCAWVLNLLLVLTAAPAAAQTYADKVVIGDTDSSSSSSVLVINGLTARTPGQEILSWSGKDVFKGLLGKADLPASTGYEDEANVWALLQTFTLGFTANAASTVNGDLTLSGANDLIVGTGGIRAGSGAITFRNVADSSTSATIGDSSIALNRNTGITGTLSVSNLSTLTGGFTAGAASQVNGTLGVLNLATLTGGFTAGAASQVNGTLGVLNLATLTAGFSAGASSSIAGNLALTGTGSVTAAGDVAVNGGDITSTASTLNVDAGGTVQINDVLVMASANTIRSANFASRTTGWGITYAGEADFRYTYADEFYTKNFIADLETALNGGQIIAKSTVILAQAFTCPAAGGTATLWVRDFPGHGNLRVFAANDWVVLRSMTRADADNDGNIEFSIGDCVGQVSSYTDGTSGNDGTQSWTFTRGSGGNAGGMAASTVIGADAIVIDYGVSGQGVLVARANDGTEGAHSPYWQVQTWATSPVAANMALRVRWGQLNGSYGYSTSTYGLAFGDAADVFCAAEATNGFRCMEGGTNESLRLDPSGYLRLGQEGSGKLNTYIDPGVVALRVNTTPWVRLTTAGVEVGQTSSGQGNTFIDTSGNYFARSGTVNRFTIAGSNGNSDWLDDDGTTVRARIGSTAAYFGSLSASRLQYTYGSGLFEGYDGSGNRRLWWDATNGLVLGTGSNVSGKPYVQLTDSLLLFCEDGGSCPLQFNGATGDINSFGSITLGTASHIKAGATAYAAGTGFWLGLDSGTPKLYVGSGTGSSDQYLSWSGSDLTVQGALIARGGLSIASNGGGGTWAINTATLSDLNIQNSTVLGKISLTASGGLEVYVDASNNGAGFTGTKTFRAAGGTSDCTVVYVMGVVVTGGTC